MAEASAALALPLRGEKMLIPVAAIGEAGYADHPAVHVRLSGKIRTARSISDAVVVCQKTERRFTPLNLLVCSGGKSLRHYGGP